MLGSESIRKSQLRIIYQSLMKVISHILSIYFARNAAAGWLDMITTRMRFAGFVMVRSEKGRVSAKG